MAVRYFAKWPFTKITALRIEGDFSCLKQLTGLPRAAQAGLKESIRCDAWSF